MTRPPVDDWSSDFDHLDPRWIENPYFQYFCGEQVFRHEHGFDRSSLSRWRRRLGTERLVALIQQSLPTMANAAGSGVMGGKKMRSRFAEAHCSISA